MFMFLLEGSVIAHAILHVRVRMCVDWCGLVCVCVCVLVCWLVCAPEVRVDCCVLRLLPGRTADAQKRVPLPPEPSSVRPCPGFAPVEAKRNVPSTQNRGRPKARTASARAL